MKFNNYWTISIEYNKFIQLTSKLLNISVTIQVTGYWLSPLGYTGQDLIIQGGQQYCWYRLLLNCIGNIDIFHQEHLWCLTDIFHLWRRCMLIDCWEDTNFHQYRILLHPPGCYLTEALCWSCVCCVITIFRIYLWWIPYARLLMMRSRIKWVQ